MLWDIYALCSGRLRVDDRTVWQPKHKAHKEIVVLTRNPLCPLCSLVVQSSD
jgi:hypothetical protein